MTASLEGKVALVAGATGGIGQSVARRLAAEGAQVVAAGRSVARLEELSAHSDAIRPFEADVAREDAVVSLVNETMTTLGRLDIVFNGAGITGPNALIEDLSVEDFSRVMDINVTGTFLVLKHTVPALRKSGGGSIINVGSAASVQAGRVTMPSYCASKHAVVGLTRVMAKAYGGENIRTNVICPGQIDTDMLAAVEQDMMEAFGGDPDAGGIEDARKKVIAAIPTGRYGTTDEVAALVAFLGRDEAAFINGSIYTIDGGFTPF